MNDIKHTQYRVLYERLLKKLGRLILKYESFEETSQMFAKTTEKYNCDKVKYMAVANAWSLAKELLQDCLSKENKEGL